MKMGERIDRIEEIHQKMDELNNSVKRSRVNEMNALSMELRKLQDIPLEDVPEYFRFNGNNIDELNQFFKEFTFENGATPKFSTDSLLNCEPIAFYRPICIHVGQVVSKEGHQIRFVENEEINLVYHILALKASNEERKEFYKNICSSLSFEDTKYESITTEKFVSAIQWRGNNYIEILDFVKPSFYINTWKDEDGSLRLTYEDTDEEFILKESDYLVRMNNPLYGVDTRRVRLNFGGESEAIMDRPSKHPFYVYDVINEEKFLSQYKKECEIRDIREGQEEKE